MPPSGQEPLRRRSVQQVATIKTRRDIVAWMVEDQAINGNRGLNGRTIRAFPEHFRGKRQANMVRASRWWALRDTLLPIDPVPALSLEITRSTQGARKRILSKAAAGRGPRRSTWVQWLYPRLLQSFEIYKTSGVKFSPALLIELALSILLALDSPYNAQSTDPKDNILLTEKITHTWIYHFMDAHSIVLLSQRGRLTCSPEKEQQIEMSTAFHLGILHRGFQSGDFDENLIENIDETHFSINMDNGRTLGFRGDTSVTYADVVAGGEAMTMVIRISGGRRAIIEAPMLIFTNSNSNYPIRGLEDSIPGVSYRTGPKGWMTQSIFPQFFEDPRSYQPDVHNRIKHVWVDNCTSHNITPRLADVLSQKRTVLKYLPPCTTHLCQPADTFIISKIKDAWTNRWEAKKTELIRNNAWQNNTRGDGHWSGKLTNPGKHFFLQLAANAVEDVNRMVDSDNISYARKAMIRCGLALDLDGTWSVEQLFPHLREIIAKHRPYFEGLEVPHLPMAN